MAYYMILTSVSFLGGLTSKYTAIINAKYVYKKHCLIFSELLYSSWSEEDLHTDISRGDSFCRDMATFNQPRRLGQQDVLKEVIICFVIVRFVIE